MKKKMTPSRKASTLRLLVLLAAAFFLDCTGASFVRLERKREREREGEREREREEKGGKKERREKTLDDIEKRGGFFS